MDTSCGENNGSATVSATGGQEPYTFVWSSADTDNMIDGLEPATYDVTVTDANGCTDTASITIEDSTGPELTVNSSPTTCGENNGGASAMVTSGTSPFTYEWSNGSTASFIGGLAAGEATATVGDSDAVNADASATETTCGENNGMATVDAVGGVEPYTYLWSTAATTQMIMGLEPGDYMVTVTDADGCTDEASVLVEDSSNPGIAIGAAPENCGMMDGAVTVSPTGGVSPYTIEWSNGSTESTQTDIDGGIYSVTVTDANGCTASSSIEVEDTEAPDGGEIAVDGETMVEFCQEGTMDMFGT